MHLLGVSHKITEKNFEKKRAFLKWLMILFGNESTELAGPIGPSPL